MAAPLVNSGKLSAADESVLSSWPKREGYIMVMDASEVASYVVAHGGVGKLPVSPTSPRLSVTPSSSVWVRRDGIREVIRPTAVPTGAPPAQQEHGILPSFFSWIGLQIHPFARCMVGGVSSEKHSNVKI
ncbi:uncharacterized protein P174DRAFT_425001 [Aspergillus novofumigatus IBT 16806]|uniref:Uncharacterized protein n=1 Tax=Aspergillus novofumigatus (strain IBT 16806) TaxID=1392255 RepID=A0A2I1BWT8_ASPN1|nr:uncharacterized protein P174DRAFT_425001 [Aspergillus novofumigatus IBT 16806]PKX89830.1 hypothetical protein P174DRAFT_425001 [Aspergillus novofumigatus IBT 16806]